MEKPRDGKWRNWKSRKRGGIPSEGQGSPRESQPGSTLYVTFPMAPIREEFNKYQFSLSVSADPSILSPYEAQRTSEMFGASYAVRLLTVLIDGQVRANPTTSSYEGYLVSFRRGGAEANEESQFHYARIAVPPATSLSLDGTQYLLTEDLHILPDGDITQARPLRTDEMKHLQARIGEVVRDTETIEVSEYQPQA